MADRIKKNIILAGTIAAVTAVLVLALILRADSSSAVFSQAGERGCIVIDAGHGLPDAGAVGAQGTAEEELNLLISSKLKACLEDMGFSVIMTREDHDAIAESKDADMARRREIISGGSQDVTVSIHQNIYAEDSSVYGAQVFFAPGSEEGERLAAAIQAELNAALKPEKPRSEHVGNSYIVKSGSPPAVIVECGFISNPQEEELLKQSQYQVKIVKAIAKGVVGYLEGNA